MANISTQLRSTIYASLFAALVAAGAFIAIPVGPVPITLQTLFVLLAGLLLGWKWGFAGIAVYILAGAVGLPVFSAGRGGIAHILGPTGGYLLSYTVAVLVIGAISGIASKAFPGKKNEQMILDIVAMVCGSAIVYAVGVPWLKMVTGMPWSKAVAVGMYPFLLGDALKIVAAVPIVRVLRPIINSD
ncbi:MAG: biotin transporter BioY [Proteobacteria bacterium]|nr:biotin transporter BioY [Pseudomonadota bacterium]